jgi:type IV pilus assembly protein PilC
MGRYLYSVQDAKGAIVSGKVDAASEEEAIQKVVSQGVLLSIQVETPSSVRGFSFGSSVGSEDIIFFGEQLSTLLEGGVPLVRAISMIGKQSESRALQDALSKVDHDVASGLSLHKAMERHPQVFGGLWVPLVQAGEIGGTLPGALTQITGYLTEQEELRAKVVTALAYPAVLIMVSAGTLAVFIVKIVPTFADIFKAFNMGLPPITRAVIFASEMLSRHIWPLAVAGACLIVFSQSALRTSVGQRAKARFLFSAPFFSDLFRHIAYERLLTTFRTLINSGVSILKALSVLDGVFGDNPIIRDALNGIREDIAGGKTVSSGFRRAGVFPEIISDMMMMGEESGRLPASLETLARYYRKRIDRFIRRFTSIIDPIMVVCIGSVIAVLMLSMFMPIFQLSQIR